MDISLTQKLEGFVKAKVKSGDYDNASAVVREALRGMQARDAERRAKVKRLKELLREGENSGPPVPWDPEAIKAEAIRRARKAA